MEDFLKSIDKKLPPKKADSVIPPSFTEPEVLHKQLIDTIRKYRPNTDISLIEKAYNIAYEAHKEQKRKSGEPYIIHPICVAIILAELELDKETIIGGLLHDVVEDTTMSYDDVKNEFSEEVALLVDGVTKLTKLDLGLDKADKAEMQAENLRKMFLAMAKDIRVILIKLADRLHNMRTLDFMKPEKQKEKARETMEIYAPIAQRLGISKVKIELDDLSLKYLEPEAYKEINEKLWATKQERDKFIDNIVTEVKQHMDHADIKAEVNGRVKHLFSIYRKMVNQNKTIDQIYDLFAVRIIVDSVKDCYAALGIIHEVYKPIPGRFKDFIAMPKENMYQSLHTTLISSTGQPFEIQIRTYEMHKVAEYGIAAHWKYKEGINGKADNEEEKLAWLRRILEWQNDSSDNKEFLSLVKSDLDLFSENVYCFTPTGEVKNLPAGSTPIDFAYAVHSAVGNKMVGARVNGRMVNIDYVIQNGDRIEIITSQNSKGPSSDWLKIVRSTQAKNKINSWFKTNFKEENISKGKELLNNYAKAHNIVLGNLLKPEYMEKVQIKYGYRDWNAILAAVGHGALKEGQVVNRLRDENEKVVRSLMTDEQIIESITTSNEKLAADPNARKVAAKGKTGVVVRGMHDLSVRFSKCCSPVPGDEIIGYVTRGRGITIHRTDCVNIIGIAESEKVRLIDAEWSSDAVESGEKFYAEIKVFANDRKGILLDFTKLCTEANIAIRNVNSRTGKQGVVTIEIGFEVESKLELTTLINKISQISGVIEVKRSVS
ncbi:MAG: bifunctional (p)ppGpp synthetase/guanosine-3',5'-bis(diphosphate) 3'-pyrophosphohydrolase [Lachnospiraceae bacterium]|nr:bifunctional (p)ppGpp synthetase/guanosine-3',5'-bis(diphosphate) 3'-pyrophosphohydrolase [Lachnospiraceae bacterium]